MRALTIRMRFGALLAAAMLFAAPVAWADASEPTPAEIAEPVTPEEVPEEITPAPHEEVEHSASSEASAPERPGASIFLMVMFWVGLMALLALGLAILLGRGLMANSRTNAVVDATDAAAASRKGSGAELDDVRRDLEAVREVFRAGGLDAEVSRCREVERDVMDLQDRIRRQPAMGTPSPGKVAVAQGMALADDEVRRASRKLLTSSSALRGRVEAGKTGDALDALDGLARTVAGVGNPMKDRPAPVDG